MSSNEKKGGPFHWIMMFLRLCLVIFVFIMAIIQTLLKRILHFIMGAFKADDEHFTNI